MMRYRLLGKSGLRVSELCLGTMTFGEDWGWGSSKDESRQILDAFFEAGGNFIDTANIYTNGTSETLLGEFLKGNRDSGRAGDEVHQRHARHRPQCRGQPAEEHDAGGRGQPQAAPDRLHRPLLAAHLGQDHAAGRGDAGVRRPRAAGQDPPRRRLRHGGVGCRPGQHAGRAARLDAVRRVADRVQPDRADGRAGTHPDGRRRWGWA